MTLTFFIGFKFRTETSNCYKKMYFDVNQDDILNFVISYKDNDAYISKVIDDEKNIKKILGYGIGYVEDKHYYVTMDNFDIEIVCNKKDGDKIDIKYKSTYKDGYLKYYIQYKDDIFFGQVIIPIDSIGGDNHD